MTINDIKNIKNIGISENIYKAITARLWEARQALEKAPTGIRDITFEENLKKAEQLIADCRQLQGEFLDHQVKV